MQWLMSSLGEAWLGSVQLRAVVILIYLTVRSYLGLLRCAFPGLAPSHVLFFGVLLVCLGFFSPPTFCATIFPRKLFHVQDLFPL